MSRHKHPTHQTRPEPTGRYSFQLSLRGIAGIGVVMFCLFLWMFLLGVWAGQTILFLPQPPPPPAQTETAAEIPAKPAEAQPVPAAAPERTPRPEPSVPVLLPQAKKKRVDSQELSPDEDVEEYPSDIPEE